MNLRNIYHIRNIQIDYDDDRIARIQLFGKNDEILSKPMGKNIPKMKTHRIKINPGEVIVGLKIQEIGFNTET